MENTTINAEVEKRPQFLTVLCILTFIGTGLMLFSSLFSIPDTFLRSPQQIIAAQEIKLAQAEQIMPGITDKMSDMIMEMAPYKIPNWLVGFIGNLFTLLGAIMMWKQKKIGFYIYTIAELVPFLISIIALKGMTALTGSMSAFGPAFAGIITTAVVLIVIFDIAFIIMYAVNLKHMR